MNKILVKFLEELDKLESENNCGTDDFIESQRIAYSKVRKIINNLSQYEIH